jgi:hypothetical protein
VRGCGRAKARNRICLLLATGIHDMTSDQKLFDVFVQIRNGLKLQDVERLSYEINAVPRDQMDVILKAFRNTPRIKVGNAVNRERADKAKIQLSKIGLDVSIAPVLSLAPVEEKVSEDLHLCGSCDTRVVLPPNRQCPNCGVFVDKISQEALLKKRIKENERLKLEMQAQQERKATEKRNQQLLEDALRKEIRKELEAEFGIQKEKVFFGGNLRLFKIAGVVLLFPVGFYGGFVFSEFGGTGQSTKKLAASAPNNPMGNSSGQLNFESLGAESFNIEDDLFYQNKPGTISLEQALKASNTLGKSLGNTGAGSAMGGRSLPGMDGVLDAENPLDPSSAERREFQLSPLQKHILLAELSKQLADMRQFQRAAQAVKQLASLPSAAYTVDFALSAPMTDLEVRAMHAMSLSAAQASKGLEELRAEAMRIVNPAERGWALSRLGVISSRHLMLPPSVAQEHFALAEKAFSLIVNVQERNKNLQGLKVATGEAQLAEVFSLVRSGQWSKVQAAMQQFSLLLGSTADPHALIRLYALDHQMKTLVAQRGATNASLDSALGLLLNMTDPAEQAVLLHEVLTFSQGFDQSQIFKLAADIKTRLLTEKSNNTHVGLMHIALLYKEADLLNEFEAVAQLLKDLPPAGAPLNSAFHTETVLRGDLLLAKKSHAAGQYHLSESQLRRLADLLSKT